MNTLEAIKYLKGHPNKIVLGKDGIGKLYWHGDILTYEEDDYCAPFKINIANVIEDEWKKEEKPMSSIEVIKILRNDNKIRTIVSAKSLITNNIYYDAYCLTMDSTDEEFNGEWVLIYEEE